MSLTIVKKQRGSLMVHLNVRSAFSLMQSTIRLEQYVALMAERGSKAVALADDALYGLPQFVRLCERYKVKPIIGLRTRLKTDGFDVTVLVYALNEEQIPELYRLVESGGVNGHTELAVLVLPENWKTNDPVHRRRLFNHLLGYVSEERLWLGLPAPQTTEQTMMVKQLREMREELGTRLVPTPETCYMRAEDYEAYRAIVAIGEGELISQEDTHQKGKYVRLPSEMNDWYEPIELEELDRFVEHVSVKRLPTATASIPEIENAVEQLKRSVAERLQQLDLFREEYIERARYELDVIARTGFASYFLIVEDIVRYAKDRGIEVGPGRGSAAGSLVSFVLGITEVDPVRFDLLFERFLNPERITMPDIDLDFEDERRDEVVRYVLEKYGDNHAAQIGTLATFGAKAALRDVARALGMTLEEGQAASKQVKDDGLNGILADPSRRKWFVSSQKRSQLLKIAVDLEGLPRQASIHAAGLVLSREPLDDITPLQPTVGEQITQYNMKDLEALGLLKIDLLGLRNLTKLRQMEALVREADELFSLKTIPLNDGKTLRILARGDTDGIFQFESTGMKQALRQVKPSEFEDIVVTMSLYRPGPMQFIDTYAKRKHGMPYQPVHPVVGEIMQKTHGVLVYQEQVMRLLRELAGYSYAEADLIRRAIAKKDVVAIDIEKARFLERSSERFDQDSMQQVFSWIEKFAGYGFNRSHAVAYSLISYRLAYVKAHFPRVFYLVTYDKTNQLVRMLRKEKIPIYPPDVLHGRADSFLEGPGVRLGLKSIQGLTKRDIEQLIEHHAEFTDVKRLLERMGWGTKEHMKLRRLLGAGALDRMYHGERRRAFEAVERLREETETHLLPDELSALGLKRSAPIEPNWSEEEREALGTWIVHSPLMTVAPLSIETMTIDEVLHGERGFVVVYVDAIRTFKTKKNEEMGVVMVDDGVSQDEVVIFPRVFAQFSRSLYVGNVLLLEVHPNERDGRRQLVVERLRPLHGQALFVRLRLESFADLEELLHTAPGDVPVVCRFSDSKEVKQLASAYAINPTEALLQGLKQRFGDTDVVLKRIDSKMPGTKTSTKS